MTDQDIDSLTDTELLQIAHRNKNEQIFDAVMVGLLAGISLYTVINKGVSWVTFIPLAYVIMAVKNERNRKKIKAEVRKRGL